MGLVDQSPVNQDLVNQNLLCEDTMDQVCVTHSLMDQEFFSANNLVDQGVGNFRGMQRVGFYS